MTSEEAKAYLIRARDAVHDIRSCESEAIWAMKNAAHLKRLQAGSDLAPAIKTLSRCGRRARIRRHALICLREAVATRIDRVPDARGREILRRRYMERQTWEQIGEALCYDVRYCSRLHNMALASAAFT